MPQLIKFPVLVILLTFGFLPMVLHGTSYAHGGKSHSDNAATPFAVVQKAIQLYDKFIAKQKLDVSWESGLRTISVYQEKRGSQAEWVVKFLRTKSNPEAVYIFFDPAGNYSGSNFTGK